MAILVGLVVAIAAVLLVLDPILRPQQAAASAPDAEPEEDPRDVKKELALAALKEIEFDRETGKLSDGDYQAMLARYTKEALEALREAEAAPVGGNGHGAAAGDDAVERLIAEAKQASKGKKFCSSCGAVLEGSGRFCVECGARM